jgi:hypothetical protein
MAFTILIVLSTGTILLVLDFLVKAVYRLHFHPLRHFPGPRIAAVTRLYQAYHQFWRHGSLTSELFELHEKYGE